MHQVLVKNDQFQISWIAGSRCLLSTLGSDNSEACIREFFGELAKACQSMLATSMALDLSDASKISEEGWDMVCNDWYPALVKLGLKRQALVLPTSVLAKMQWRGLVVANLMQNTFGSISEAIHWLGRDDDDRTATKKRMKPLVDI